MIIDMESSITVVNDLSQLMHWFTKLQYSLPPCEGCCTGNILEYKVVKSTGECKYKHTVNTLL